MKKSLIAPAVVMLLGILGITNPAFKQPYQFFDDVEGKVIHNYFIFSVYKQFNGYSVSPDGKFIIYKRYIGVAMNYFEISPERKRKE